jgi:tetratricopeptide (TPR) repeat protein
LKDYDEAIRLDPDYALAYVPRALARNEKGDLNGALKDLDEAVRLDPVFCRRAVPQTGHCAL